MISLRKTTLCAALLAAVSLPVAAQDAPPPPDAPMARNARGDYGQNEFNRDTGRVLMAVADRAREAERIRETRRDLRRSRAEFEDAGANLPEERRERLGRMLRLRSQLLELETAELADSVRDVREPTLEALSNIRDTLTRLRQNTDRQGLAGDMVMQRIDAAEAFLKDLPEEDEALVEALADMHATFSQGPLGERMEAMRERRLRGDMDRDRPGADQPEAAPDRRLMRIEREVEALQRRQQMLLDELERLRAAPPPMSGGPGGPGGPGRMQGRPDRGPGDQLPPLP